MQKLMQNPLLSSVSFCANCGKIEQMVSADHATADTCHVCGIDTRRHLDPASLAVQHLADFREFDALINALVDHAELEQLGDAYPTLDENKVQLDFAGVLSDSFQVTKTDCDGYAELCVIIDLIKSAKLLLARRTATGKINMSNAIATLQQQTKHLYRQVEEQPLEDQSENKNES
tara:strand:- start:1325 stop:1849 length:525 start_codon:yes stop_codon:yes gene_type:complete